MYGKILVAVAEDEIARATVATAAHLASALGARLALVHAIDPAAVIAPLAATEAGGIGVPTLAGGAGVADATLLDDQRARGEAFLAEIAIALPGGVAAETALREGSPAGAVLAAAAEWGAELIVTGTHGRRGLERLVLGSTAEAILREAPCPVLVLRAGTAAP